MNIRLLKLAIRNFKGIKDFTFTPAGEDCSVSAINGSGKTSITDAWNWLCFGKDSYGNSQFGIKPTDIEGKEIHNLQHSAEAEIDVESEGFTVVEKLKKVMTENWKTKKGTSVAEFSGHITEYWINEVPSTKTEYDAYIAKICGKEETFRLLTSTKHFNSDAFGKANRRRMILEIAGNISDADVIAANESLKDLPKILGSRTLSDHLKTIKAKRPEVNKQIDQIKPRIDEAGLGMPIEASMIPPAGSYGELKIELETMIRRRASLLAGDTSETAAKITAINEEIAKRKADHATALQAAKDNKRVLEQAAENIGREIERQEINASRGKLKEDEIESRLARMRKDYDDEEAMAYHQREDQCYHCHQALPPEMVMSDEEYNEGKAEFEKAKAATLEGLNAKGITETAALEGVKIARQGIADKIKQLTEQKETETKAAAAVVMPEEPDNKLLLDAIDALNVEIASKATPDTEEIDKKIDALNISIAAHDAASDNVKIATEKDARIKQLDAEKKQLGKDLEKIDKEIVLCESFTRLKSAMLTETVNAKFEPVSFKLFNEQINGGIADECELMMYSQRSKGLVVYSELSTGEQAVAGLTINKVLSEHYGITVPVFVDCAEGITLKLPKVENGQYIRLRADEAFLELTVQRETLQEVAA